MRVIQFKHVNQITRRFFAKPLLHVKSYPSLRAKTENRKNARNGIKILRAKYAILK